MAARRSTDSNASQPAMKVVGFHVEGVPPSPQTALLHDALTSGGGSPDPVIIPPSFQSELAGRVTLAASPERTNTLPSFMPQAADSAGVREILSGGLSSGSTSNVHRPMQDLRSGSASPALAHTSSLPPMTSSIAADWKHFAAAIGRAGPHSPPDRDGSASQPASRNITPPVSPFPERPASYRPSAFELAQGPHGGLGGQAATIAEGSRQPERPRRIQAHMAATFSDGSRMAPGEPSRHELGTPRQQHGFQVGAGRPDPVSPLSQHGAHPTMPPPQHGATPRAPASGQSTPTAAHHTSAGPSSRAGSRTGSRSTSPRPGNQAALPAVPHALAASSTAMSGRTSPAPEQHQGNAVASSSRPEREAQPGAGDGKKTTTKAERRALQERQRAEKAAAKDAEARRSAQPAAVHTAAQRREAGGTAPAASAPRSDGPPGQGRSGTGAAAAPPPALGKAPSKTRPGKAAGVGRTSEIFAHLPPYKAITIDNVFQESAVAARVHPAILRLGLQYANGTITGGNARCLAMLLAFKTVIQDYQTPESKELSRDLTSQLNICIQFLVECRPLSVSMGTAIKNLKLKVSHVDAATSQDDAKLQLLEEIDTFIQEKITYADEQVARIGAGKVASGDVVLTFAYSSAVANTLLAARKEGLEFSVVIVDSRPHFEGKLMLSRLLSQGVPCTYLHLNSLAYTMQEVTKVFLGASGALSNGTVLARAGSASVAMAAADARRPVIVCCETLKFVDRVQLDSITYNELGDPAALAAVQGRPDLADLAGWEEQPQLELLNLVYDAMPCDYVTMLITEVGAIPPTSIPVILREYRTAPRM